MWIRTLSRSFLAVINRISQVAGAIGTIFLLAMVALITVNVLLRYFLNSPIPGNVELIQYFMVVAGFLTLAWCAVKGGHLKVELILSRLPLRFQSITDSITLILGLTVVPLVAWQAFMQTWDTLIHKSASFTLEIPQFPFYMILGLGVVLLFLVMVTLLVQLIAKALQK